MNAQTITQQLRNAGWTDAAIARRCGCSQPTITRIRNGRSDPRGSTLLAIASLVVEIKAKRPPQNAA